MIPNFTYRARNYVQRSPQCKDLSGFERDRLIKGIAKLLGWAYKQGFEQGKAHSPGCGCNECQTNDGSPGISMKFVTEHIKEDGTKIKEVEKIL